MSTRDVLTIYAQVLISIWILLAICWILLSDDRQDFMDVSIPFTLVPIFWPLIVPTGLIYWSITGLKALRVRLWKKLKRKT